jgi:predicted TIM-barrel fold metal-dependent hydrolase
MTRIGLPSNHARMFSSDYPFDSAGAAEFMDAAALDESLRADIAYNNAAKLLRLG